MTAAASEKPIRGARSMPPRKRASRAGRLRVAEETIYTPEPRPGYAEAGDVEEFAEGLPVRYLHCRDMNHNWRPFNVGRHKDGGYERQLRCVRCKCLKTQHLDSAGMLVGGTKYEHPDGYLLKGLGRIVGDGRGVLRLESMKRIGIGE